MTSKAKRKDAKFPHITGVRPSIHNAQLLVSSGMPSLDRCIGGGLPVGSTCIVEEDTYGLYSRTMLKYFMAEGAVSSHRLLVASKDISPSTLLSELPALAEPTKTPNSEPSDERMQIAWRYQNMRIADDDSDEFGHRFDLTKRLQENCQTDAIEWNGQDTKCHSECSAFANPDYADLLRTIEETLRVERFRVDDRPEKRNVLRVAVHCLGSRLWISDQQDQTNGDLVKFLYCLRALLRTSYAVGMLTVPVGLYEPTTIDRAEHCADVAIRLESFAAAAEKVHPLLRDYHGLLHIRKAAAINALSPHPLPKDLAFKLRRRKFLVEVLHLPPELGNAQREQDDGASLGCAASKSLDF